MEDIRKREDLLDPVVSAIAKWISERDPVLFDGPTYGWRVVREEGKGKGSVAFGGHPCYVGILAGLTPAQARCHASALLRAAEAAEAAGKSVDPFVYFD